MPDTSVQKCTLLPLIKGYFIALVASLGKGYPKTLEVLDLGS